MSSASTASMQFTPEWLKPGRKQPSKQPSFSSLDEEPVRKGSADHPHSAAPSYSSLVSGGVSPANLSLDSGVVSGQGPPDAAHPFRYSKEQMLNVWKEGGAHKGVLGAEVARWPGIVRDAITEPVGLREPSAEEKKIFSQSLNPIYSNSSYPRRHGLSNAVPPLNTTVGGGSAKSAFTGGLGSPRTERFGGTGAVTSAGSGLTRRRKDETGDTPAAVGVYRPRQLSLSNPGLNTHSLSGGSLPSPRPRGSGIDGVMGESWMRRRVSDRGGHTSTELHAPEVPLPSQQENGDEGSMQVEDSVPVNASQPESLAALADSPHSIRDPDLYASPSEPGPLATPAESRPASGLGLPSTFSESVDPANSDELLDSHTSEPSHDFATPSIILNESVLWRYKDHDGQIQGPFGASIMQSWYERQYFQDNLPIQRFEPPYDSLDPAAFETLAEYKKKLPPALEPSLFMKGMELAPPRPPNLPMPSTAPAPTEGSSEQPMSIFSSSRSVSGLSSAPRSDIGFGVSNQSGGANGYVIYPSGLAGSGSITRSASGRQGSFDSFSGSSGFQNSGVAPSPLNSSPALSSGMAQSYGAPPSGFLSGSSQTGSAIGATTPAMAPSISGERERQERDEFFKLLREKELASGSKASGPVRTNSVSSGISGPFGNGSGIGVGVGQPVPMFPNTAAPGPIGSYQQGAPPTQSQSQLMYNAAFPRPSPYPQQQGSAPATPYQQHPPSNNAWLQPPSGYLARQILPPPPPSNVDTERPIGRLPTWDEPRPQDTYSHHQRQQEQVWPQQQPEQEPVFSHSRLSRKSLPPLSFVNMAARYSTTAAVQSVQTQSAGNFGLPKGFVEPPEKGSQQSLESHPASQQLPENHTAFSPITDEQVDRLTSHFHDIQVQEALPPQLPADSTVAPVTTTPAVGPIASPVASPAESYHPLATRARVADDSAAALTQAPAPAPSTAPKGEETTVALEIVEPAPTKSTRKASASIPKPREIAVAPPAPDPAPVSATPASASSPVASPTKLAWTTPSNVTPTNGGTPGGRSLREIQEAEAKRSEARKEKVKAKRAAALAVRESSAVPPTTDTESIPKTTTWGLSLSQAGHTSRGSSGGTGTTGSSPAAASTNVWSKPQATKGGAAKKSMKEILEEEERRKKAAAVAGHADTQNAANGSDVGPSFGKKAYVETAKAGDAKASPTPSGGGVWVTVGSKSSPSSANTNAATPAVRVPAAPTIPTSSNSVKLASLAVPPKTAAALVRKKASNATPAAQDDKIPSPSTEFLKWTQEALSGLTGVNIDEFITMLLDFPIEPDASTVEIISDSVYANSSVLDGRRFATDFVSRRKADVARVRSNGVTNNASGGGASGGNVGATGSGRGKGVSIADVVKTQPRAAEKEWGYKVVKKKGKKT